MAYTHRGQIYEFIKQNTTEFAGVIYSVTDGEIYFDRMPEELKGDLSKLTKDQKRKLINRATILNGGVYGLYINCIYCDTEIAANPPRDQYNKIPFAWIAERIQKHEHIPNYAAWYNARVKVLINAGKVVERNNKYYYLDYKRPVISD